MKKNKLFWILTVVCVLNFMLLTTSTLPCRTCAYPLGRKRAGQRLGAEIHGFDFGRAAVCDVDFV